MSIHAHAQEKTAPTATKALTPLVPALAPARPGLLQRKCACGGTPGVDGECAECRAKRLGLQRQAASPATPAAVPPIVYEVLRSPGQPLDAGTRAFMEPRFGHDLSRVRVHNVLPIPPQARLTIGQPGDQYEQEADQAADRVMRKPGVPGLERSQTGAGYDFSQVHVHTDARAAESARAVNALAYTVGKDVVFGAGQYAPGTAVGRRLLAHELAHTIQQTTGDAKHGEQPARLQRTLGDGHDLSSPRFAGDPVLEACFDNERLLKFGDRGDAVRTVQQALLDLNDPTIALPVFGVDGIFLSETREAVKSFQRASGLAGQDVDGIVGPITMGLLDARFPAVSPPEPTPPAPTPPAPTPPASTCSDDPQVNTEKDPLPPVPPFSVKQLSAPELFEKVKQLKPPDQPLPKKLPLGATAPRFSNEPVKVKALPVPGSPCMKCVAEWNVVPTVEIFIAVGSFTDEPKRFAAIREGDESGCPPSNIPHLLEVRKIILSQAVPFLIAGEHEHYLDFVRAFLFVGGRHLANVRRLTPERTHLRGKDLDECTQKVEIFLSDISGVPGFSAFLKSLGVSFLKTFTEEVFVSDFQDVFGASSSRDDKAHIAVAHPPENQKPLFPNIDLDINPFGCKAFCRKFDARSFPGVPGASSEQLIKDKNEPPKQKWHVL